MTWSPGASEVTPAPTSTTTPAPSWPKITGNRPSGSAPDRVNSSVWHTPVALSSTSTSPALGPARSTSSTTSGLPTSNAIAARVFIVAGLASGLRLGREGREHVHQRRVQRIVRLEPELAQPGADAGHLRRVDAALDHRRHERRELGRPGAGLAEQLGVDERQPLERVDLLDRSVHVRAARGAGVALDQRRFVDDGEPIAPRQHLDLVAGHDGDHREDRPRWLPALGAAAHVVVRDVRANRDLDWRRRTATRQRAAGELAIAGLEPGIDRRMDVDRHASLPWPQPCADPGSAGLPRGARRVDRERRFQPGWPRSPRRKSDGVTPNRLRNARLKCAELENPQANAISEMLRSARRARSPRQPSSRVVQIWSVIERSLAANAMCK